MSATSVFPSRNAQVAASSTVHDGPQGGRMQALNIVVYQRDPRLAQALASTFSQHYHAVYVATSVDELRVDVPRHRADVAVVDIEASCLAEVERLHREFPQVSIVCTHRVADEEMWAAALNAGA